MTASRLALLLGRCPQMDEKAFDSPLNERPGPRPGSREKWSSPGREVESEAGILAALQSVVIVSRSGDREHARRLCAAILLHSQPLIASRRPLLSEALRALLVAHGFRLLSRFVSATHGPTVHVSWSPDSTGQPRMYLEARRLRLGINQRWLDELSPDDLLLRDLCYALGYD